MAKQLRINDPAAGPWIMSRLDSVFSPDRAVTIANFDGDQVLGGFVLENYTGASMLVHMAGSGPGWCSRELLAVTFDYAFNQVGVTCLLAPVSSGNAAAMSQDLRGGFRVAARVPDIYPDGDLVLLQMRREDCRWLRLRLREHVSNRRVA
jgi:hypothetical protein